MIAPLIITTIYVLAFYAASLLPSPVREVAIFFIGTAAGVGVLTRTISNTRTRHPRTYRRAADYPSPFRGEE